MTTKIEWTEETWNPVTGCTKVSPGCANCYAERMAKRLAGRFGYPADDPFKVTLHPDRLDQPLRWKKPRRVFVCSMSDLFHDDVPWPFVSKVFTKISATPHIYQILTKRPMRMREWQVWSGWLEPRVWLGVSAENQEWADKRIPTLLDTPAAVRFVSVEPMLGPVDLGARWLWGSPYDPNANRVNWVIIGCESGPGRRPMKLEWAADLVGQCKAAGTPVFVKQIDRNGKVSHDPREWPEVLRVREYPREVGE